MTHSFTTAINNTQQKTWNGAHTLSTPDKTNTSAGLLSLFYSSVRGLNAPRLFEILNNAIKDNKVDTILLIFHIRDCRNGKGERYLGRLAFSWLFVNYPDDFLKVFSLIPEYGRWDDLLDLWPSVLDLSKDINIINSNWYSNITSDDLVKLRKLQINFVKFYAKQLLNDVEKMKNGDDISLCAKWAPTEKDSLDFKHKIVSLLCKELKLTPRNYRKCITTPLREYLNIVEKLMCTNKWDDIEYSKVPSCAMKRLKNSFEKHNKSGFEEWKNKLREGKVKVNYKQIFPYELVQEVRNGKYDQVSERQWKNLENKTCEKEFLKDCICVTDVSGSMTFSSSGSSVCPMDVAISLSLIISNAVKGQFHNNIITFDEKPSFYVIEENSLDKKVKQILSAPWGMSTDIMAVFKLILKSAIIHNLKEYDMPKNIFIFSDMQFNDTNTGKTNFQEIEKEYKIHNYKRPNIIFWNVNGKTNDYPVSTDSNGTCLISGFSSNIIQALLEGDSFNCYDIMRRTINNKRYDPIRELLLKS